MANPVIETINEWTWVKVATGVVTGKVYRVNPTINYYHTHRLTTTGAPGALTIGTIPDEAVRMFGESTVFDIFAGASADIYVMCANFDDDADDDVGKVRVDL